MTKKYPKNTDPEMVDEENPDWTDQMFREARPAYAVLPDLVASSQKTRGKQKQPTKELVSIRLSPEVLEYFRSSGKGWQSRLNKALLDVVSTSSEKAGNN